MPTSTRRARLATLLAAGMLTSSIALTGSAGAAGVTVPCGSRQTVQAFRQWGDPASYFLAPNGGFEAGATDWVMGGGATVVEGNEPWKVRSSTDSKSLSLPYGASAESRTMCTTLGEHTVRLFVRDPGVLGSTLRVEMITRNPTTGIVLRVPVDTFSVTSGWRPTRPLMITFRLSFTGRQDVAVRIISTGLAKGTWRVDDVFVDPVKWV